VPSVHACRRTQVLKLNLVLFTDALLHLMRASRLMAMARGSGLLVGVGGSGKQSLARLAAYINGAVPFQITVTKVRTCLCCVCCVCAAQ
jgi:dynein heavy chain